MSTSHCLAALMAVILIDWKRVGSKAHRLDSIDFSFGSQIWDTCKTYVLYEFVLFYCTVLAYLRQATDKKHEFNVCRQY